MKKKIVPVLVILLALAALALLAGFACKVLTGQWPAAKNTKVENAVVVELDDAWADGLAALPTVQRMKNTIDTTLDAAQGRLHANCVLLTGRTSSGRALFRDSTGTLTTAAAITAGDKFLSRFDALQYLIRAASARGIEVMLLATNDTGARLPYSALESRPAWLTKLADAHGLAVFGSEDAPEGSVVTWLRSSDGARALARADGNVPALLTALHTFDACEPLLGTYTALAADNTDGLLYTAFAQSGSAPDVDTYKNGLTVARTLAVAYPVTDGSTVTTSTAFLMGTSNPDADLTLNGEAVARGNTSGVWGTLVSLDKGDNTFTLQNGSETLTYTVKRASASSGSTAKPRSDGTVAAEKGARLRVTDAIASALKSPSDSSSISETLYRGAVAEVVASRQYQNGTKLTYAYQLSTGDWVRSTSCELFTQESSTVLSTPEVTRDEAARSTVLTFAGGTPAVFHTWEDGALKLTFLSAGFNGELSDPTGFITGIAAENTDTSFVLTLNFAEADPLYGWAVNYDTEANTTSIWLKAAPKLSSDAAAPLAGVRVMLDAGHGGSENGAMGAAGMTAPREKELNLAVTMAAKYRLEQLGAAVLLTRSDDSTVSLGDRVTALNEQHPDFFIAIHHNSLELTSDINQAWGTEAYWFYDEADGFANSLMQTVCTATSRQTRDVKYGYYYVTRSNICPATLLELGFMTNPSEYVDCESADSIWAEGTAIAESIYRTVAAKG